MIFKMILRHLRTQALQFRLTLSLLPLFLLRFLSLPDLGDPTLMYLNLPGLSDEERQKSC